MLTKPTADSRKEQVLRHGKRLPNGTRHERNVARDDRVLAAMGRAGGICIAESPRGSSRPSSLCSDLAEAETVVSGGQSGRIVVAVKWLVSKARDWFNVEGPHNLRYCTLSGP